jgi:hypothetical protein
MKYGTLVRQIPNTCIWCHATLTLWIGLGSWKSSSKCGIPPLVIIQLRYLASVFVSRPNHKAAPRFKVPELPNPIVLSAVFMHPQDGLYLVKDPEHYDTSRQFFMKAEAPHFVCRGEQFGIRLGMFNYWDQALEVYRHVHFHNSL